MTRENTTNSEEENRFRQLQIAYRDLMKTAEGKAVIWDILGMCGIYVSSFSGDANTTFFLDGKRSIGLQILERLEHADSTIYPRLCLEIMKNA